MKKFNYEFNYFQLDNLIRLFHFDLLDETNTPNELLLYRWHFHNQIYKKLLNYVAKYHYLNKSFKCSFDLIEITYLHYFLKTKKLDIQNQFFLDSIDKTIKSINK